MKTALAADVLDRLRNTTNNKQELDEIYGQAEPMQCSELIGDWRGYMLPHGWIVLAWMLKAFSRTIWYGKRFITVDDVQALILKIGSLRFRVPFFGAARLLDEEHSGKMSAAMQYKHLPVIDYMRKVDDDTVLGAWTTFGAFTAYFVLMRQRDDFPNGPHV